MDKKAVEDTIQTLEDIKGSVEFYERDKPEFVEALQQGIQALEAMDKAGEELDIRKFERLAGLCEGITIGQAEMITSLFRQKAIPIVSKLLQRIKELEEKNG